MSDFQRAIDILTQGDRHRVWSLVVTVFGDLAREEGDEISAQTLGKLTEPLGVKSEALRVALHRLRKEGWLESRRTGRSSSYFLTKFGQSQTKSATPRIYCQTLPETSDWRLLLSPGSSASTISALASLEATGDIVRLGNSSFFGKYRSNEIPDDVFAAWVEKSEVPDWVKTAVVTQEICNSYAKLAQSFKSVSDCLGTTTDAIERAALRTLIVHSWRRTLLRHMDIPASFYPSDCQAHECKDLFLGLLEKLPRPMLEEISGG